MDKFAVNNDLGSLLQSENRCPYTDISDPVLDMMSLSSKTKLNVLHLNIRSFHKNSDALLMLLNDLQEKGIIIHVVRLCETFLSKANESMANLENYHMYHKCRSDRLGGDVSLLIHDSVKLL